MEKYSNLVGCMPTTFVYLIKIDGDVCYVGSTNNPQKRFATHKSELQSLKHSNKTLQKKYIDSTDGIIEFEIVIGTPSNSTVLKFFMEMLAISAMGNNIVNKPHIQIGRMKCNLTPCDGYLAREILKLIAEYYQVELNLPVL